MKKNKTMAYAVAATLLVGGTFVGTKALFTDKVNVAGELAISTGDLDIEVVEEEGKELNAWYLKRNGSENSDGTKNVQLVNNGDTETSTDDNNVPDSTTSVFANNLKPGDKLYKDITIENKGTLLAKVTLGENFENNTLDVLAGLVSPSQTVIVDTNNNDVLGDEGDMKYTNGTDVKFDLIPGQKAQITLELNVNNTTRDDHNTTEDNQNYNDDTVESTVVNLNGVWTLEAVQQNPDNIR